MTTKILTQKIFVQWTPRGKWRLVQNVGGRTTSDIYKPVYPHEQFSPAHEARRFLYERGELSYRPTERMERRIYG